MIGTSYIASFVTYFSSTRMQTVSITSAPATTRAMTTPTIAPTLTPPGTGQQARIALVIPLHFSTVGMSILLCTTERSSTAK